MRILSAFFAVLFTFINPTMIVNVIAQVEAFFNTKLPDHLRFAAMDILVHHLKASDHRIKAYVYGCGEWQAPTPSGSTRTKYANDRMKMEIFLQSSWLLFCT